ncbi:ABC transporter substrate-binding protein [Catonella massiliensis]|uniref:ABC transporter substrate-binding protein n=1 Tax=Catonella massiliensis TaxID=2799636 RepID=A0ABS1IYN6_9FIRM|nr:ABC transporter substrate-binding protein [Catonella massiliensis]MBK5896957.1 ABC transporter substrate-binding protein [Catonella massiliensis]
MKKKKLLSALLAGVMAVTLTACGGNSASTEGSTSAASGSTASTASAASGSTSTASGSTSSATETPVDGGQLIIGDQTQSNGDIYPYWSNNVSDNSVYKLTSGYDTIVVDKNGKFVVDPQVVKEKTDKKNDDGTITTTYKLQEDLKWSNGEGITAKDYVFRYLFFSSPQLVEMGASDNTEGSKLVGFADFNAGKTKVFKGVRLLGDYEFSVTINKDYLPNYYQDALTASSAGYMKGWLPGYDIKDDGKGAYFTKDLDAKKLNKQVNAYRMDLKVYSGPYMKEKYDETSNTYTLVKNPNYKGNYEGQKPHIDTIIYKFVQPETQMDELNTGSVDILVKMGEANEINSGMDLVDKGTHSYVDYPRNGYGRILFVCDRGPTQYAEVRRAVAYLLDRNEFAKTFTGGHGSVVNGYYGTAQWMVEEREDEIGKLNQYSFSVEKAVAELEKAGFTLGKDGKPYKSGLRYKKLDDGKLMPLTIKWCSSENNPVSDLLATKLANSEDVKKAGMEIKQTVVTFNELIQNYEQSKPNDYNMYNLGIGFNVLYEPEQAYKVGGPANKNKISDKELAKLAKDLNLVDPSKEDEYLDKFVAFQKRWNDQLPDIPLYSNQYYDFFTKKLKGYEGIKDAIWDITSQLNYCWVQE